jgi:hypothetical protein
MLDPQKSITYTNANLNKKVIYRTFVSNQYNNIAKNSSFNQFINSGIVHPTGVLIVPFIGSQSSEGSVIVNGSHRLAHVQLQLHLVLLQIFKV